MKSSRLPVRVVPLALAALVLALPFALADPPQKQGPQTPPAGTAAEGSVHEITSEAEFDQQIAGATTPVLADFRADWCPPCRRLEPVLESFAANNAGRVTVLSVDVDLLPHLATRHSVEAIPALFVYRDGQVAASHVGYTDERGLTALVFGSEVTPTTPADRPATPSQDPLSAPQVAPPTSAGTQAQ